MSSKNMPAPNLKPWSLRETGFCTMPTPHQTSIHPVSFIPPHVSRARTRAPQCTGMLFFGKRMPIPVQVVVSSLLSCSSWLPKSHRENKVHDVLARIARDQQVAER